MDSVKITAPVMDIHITRRSSDVAETVWALTIRTEDRVRGRFQETRVPADEFVFLVEDEVLQKCLASIEKMSGPTTQDRILRTLEKIPELYT